MKANVITLRKTRLALQKGGAASRGHFSREVSRNEALTLENMSRCERSAAAAPLGNSVIPPRARSLHLSCALGRK